MDGKRTGGQRNRRLDCLSEAGVKFSYLTESTYG